MKKTLVTLGLVGLVVLCCAMASKGDNPPQYKNLKILPQDITHEQMDSVMHHFTGSLGVRCNFCHVRNEAANEWDWASDSNKHKLVARDMMTMTNELNKQYFNFTGAASITINTPLMVTCYTCHHGTTEPVVNPPKQERPQPQPAMDSTKKS